MDSSLESSQDRLCLVCRTSGHIVQQCPWFMWKANNPSDTSHPPHIELTRPFPPYNSCYPSTENSKQAMCQRCQGLDEWRQITGHQGLTGRRHFLGTIKYLDLFATCPSCRLIFDITYLADEDISSVISGSELVLATGSTISRLEKALDSQETDGGGMGSYAKCVYTSVKWTVAHWGDNCVTAKRLYEDPGPAPGMSSSRAVVRSSRSSTVKRGRPAPAARSSPLWTYNSSTPVENVVDAVALADVGGSSAPLGVRKVDPHTPDYNIVKDWFRRCDALHPTTCQPIISESLKQIKLIDVEIRRIVLHPPEGCDYLALSYVWGGVEQASYNLGDTLPIVPATLEDAMVVTRNLGKRYLWADALCINQRDYAEKAVQIALMSAIYSGAWATIICLSGASADSGLPRVGTLKGVIPQLTYEIWGKRMLSVMPTLAQQISWSNWATRAWTFQEGLLSPRRLFFTNHQVYFECNSSQCCESLDDTHSPFHLASDEQRRAALCQVTQGSKDGRPENVVGTGVLRDPFRKMLETEGTQLGDGHFTYHTLMSTFTKRKMTYDADSLNAFSAMLTRLRDTRYKSGFVHGLPVEDMPRALLWCHSSQSRPRVDFPTWSWAGWEGEVNEFVVHGAESFVEALMPPLRVWKAGNAGQPELVFEFNPTPWALKKLEEHRNNRQTEEDWLVDLESDPVLHLAKTMLVDIPSAPREIDRNELVIDGIVLRLMLIRSRYGTPLEGRLRINLEGVYAEVKFQGHNAETLVNTRHGKEQDFLLLSREPVYFSESIYVAMLLIDWDGDTARRVGVATMELSHSRNGLLERLEPGRRLLRLK